MKNISTLLFLLLAPLTAMAAGGGATYPHDEFSGSMTNAESVQRGAKYYVNYCLGCHSLKYQRYNRIGMDTGLSEEVIKDNLIFTGAAIASTMDSAIPAAEAAEWFGKLPPDLSLISRSKGKDYIYNYMRGFYADDSKGTGVNNSVFPDVGMPHVLASLEGMKKPIYDDSHHVVGFEKISEGSMSEAEYTGLVYDLSNFLYYVSDPSQIKRHKLGWKVLLFLLLMTVVFYLLKKEYWRDIH